MSRNVWGILAAGAAGALLGSELGNLVDPALSALGAIDTSSLADAVNGQPAFDDFDTSSSDTYADSQDASNPAYNNLSPHHLIPGVTEHLNGALHSVAGGVVAQLSSANTGPLVNRNGLPILRRLNLKDPHTCSHCGEFIFGTRLKCLHCPDFDSCTKEACMALVDHRHAPGHSFMMIPQVGNYVVIRSQGMSVFCEGCKQGVPGKKFFSCLTCPHHVDYCPSCFMQGKSKPHSAHFSGHLFISVVRAGFSCDGCSKDVSDLPWFECSVCGGDKYGLCLDCYPRAMQLHPQHGFRRTFGCELSNVQPQSQVTPGPPPFAYQPYSPAPSRQFSQHGAGLASPPPYNAQPHPGQYQRPSGITCGMCRRFTAGQWWVCTLCPNNTVCNNCIQPAYAQHGHPFRSINA